MLSTSGRGGGEAGRSGICAKRNDDVVLLATLEAGGSVIWPS